MEATVVLGIDAGSSNTVAALAELVDGIPQVIGVGLVPSAGVRKGLVVDLTAASAAMGRAAAAACEMAGRPLATRAVTSISGAHLATLVTTAEVAVHRPPHGVTPEDVRRALDAARAVEMPPDRTVIHVAPRCYQIDDADGVATPLGLAGRRLSVESLLITGDELPIQNHLRAVSLAGFDVVDYQVGIRAAGESVLTPAERDAGALLLDIGGGTTGVAVYDQGHLWHVSVIPVGGDHITTDIATLMGIPVAAAERLKQERAWAAVDLAPESSFELVSPSGQKVREVTDRQLAEVVEPRVQEILELAASQVKRSGYGGLFPGGLVLTGGGARLQGLTTVAADSLSLPTRLGAPAGPLLGGPEFATVAGLVQWGARLAEDEAAAARETGKRDKWGRVKGWLRGLFG